MRHGIIWMGAIVALCSFTASHAEDARESDPVVVTRSFLGAWAASNVDDLMGFMANDAVIVISNGARLTGEQGLRRVLGGLKGLQNRDYEVRLDGDRIAAHGKTYGYVPYVDLGIEPGEWEGSTVVKNGHIEYFEWYYTPEFNAILERACLRKPDYIITGMKCLDFSARVKAHTENARQK